jgi:AcrR family transcriptional regulator
MGTAAETRTALVKAAFQVLAQQGFEGLRTRAVAAAVGVNVATLHYHFKSKEDLVAAVLDEELMRRFREAPAARLPLDSPPQDVLRAHFAAVAHWARHAPDVQVVWHEFWLRSMRDDALKARVNAVMTRHRRALQKALEHGGQATVATLAHPHTASMLAALLAGLTMYAMVDPNTDEAQAIGQSLIPLLTLPKKSNPKQDASGARRTP